MQHPIGESELIINSSGCIYHLGIHPDDLADTIILVGDPARVALVSQHFDSVEVQHAHREFITHTGYIGNKRLSVISTGIGPDNIDIVMNEIDALANINFTTRLANEQLKSLQIIRLGTSGSVQPGIAPGQLIVSTFAIGLDNLLHYYRYENNAEEAFLLHAFQQHTGLSGNPVQPYIAEGSVRLRNHFMQGYMQGITVTCPGFYAPQGRRLRLPPANPHLIDSLGSFSSGSYRIANFEMETAAIYGLGKLLGHNCISISCIIDNRLSQSFTNDLWRDINKMIASSLGVIIGL